MSYVEIVCYHLTISNLIEQTKSNGTRDIDALICSTSTKEIPQDLQRTSGHTHTNSHKITKKNHHNKET